MIGEAKASVIYFLPEIEFMTKRKSTALCLMYVTYPIWVTENDCKDRFI